MARQSGLRSSMPCVWSAWGWLKRTPSSRLTSAPISCSRKSGDVSTSTVVAPSAPKRSTSTEQRRRRFFGLAGSQAPHPSPTRGTPPDEAQPRMVSRSVNATIRQPAAACREPAAACLRRPSGQPLKDCVGVGARRLGQRFGRDSARLGDHARRGDHEGRLVAAAAMGRRREIGGVGLDQNAVERNVAGDGAQILRLLERHHAGKRDHEPEAERGLRELRASR